MEFFLNAIPGRAEGFSVSERCRRCGTRWMSGSEDRRVPAEAVFGAWLPHFQFDRFLFLFFLWSYWRKRVDPVKGFV